MNHVVVIINSSLIDLTRTEMILECEWKRPLKPEDLQVCVVDVNQDVGNEFMILMSQVLSK